MSNACDTTVEYRPATTPNILKELAQLDGAVTKSEAVLLADIIEKDCKSPYVAERVRIFMAEFENMLSLGMAVVDECNQLQGELTDERAVSEGLSNLLDDERAARRQDNENNDRHVDALRDMLMETTEDLALARYHIAAFHEAGDELLDEEDEDEDDEYNDNGVPWYHIPLWDDPDADDEDDEDEPSFDIGKFRFTFVPENAPANETIRTAMDFAARLTAR